MVLPFTLQQLRIVKTIAVENSFKMAADVLFMSQPSLSKQVKLLENRLGILLFDRSHRKIKLTQGGELFLKYADRTLSLCEETCRALNDLKNGDRGNLTVGASQTIGTYLVPRIVALFAKNYPQIKLKINVDSTRIITKQVICKDIDIALVGGQIPEDLNTKLEIETFAEDEFNLIVPKSHPFVTNKLKVITKEDLYHLNFIALNDNSTIRKFIDTVLTQNQIEIDQFNIIMQLNSIEAIKTAVSLGLGVAFVSASAIEKEIELQTLEIIKIENLKITRTISIIMNPDYYRSKAFEFFYDELHYLKNNLD